MNLTVHITDEIAGALSTGRDKSRCVLEGFAIGNTSRSEYRRRGCAVCWGLNPVRHDVQDLKSLGL
jgi:hypothetical protein